MLELFYTLKRPYGRTFTVYMGKIFTQTNPHPLPRLSLKLFDPPSGKVLLDFRGRSRLQVAVLSTLPDWIHTYLITLNIIVPILRKSLREGRGSPHRSLEKLERVRGKGGAIRQRRLSKPIKKRKYRGRYPPPLPYTRPGWTSDRGREPLPTLTII